MLVRAFVARILPPVTLLVVSLAPVCLGATYILPPDRALVEKTEIVLRGRVIDVVAAETPEEGIHTRVTLAVRRVLKGSTRGGTIVLKQPGGTVGGRSEIYPGIGTFAAGEEVLVMLDRAGTSSYRLTDFALGKFRVIKTLDGKEVLRRDGLREALLLSADPSGERERAHRPQPRSRVSDPDRDASAFERYVTALVHGLKPVADYVLPEPVAAEDRFAEFVFLGNPPARWTQFDAGITVTYRDNATGDGGAICSPDGCHEQVGAGIQKWTDLPSAQILLAYGGTDPTVGSKCLNALNNQIQFNDPCNELTNLSGCAGTLALGGFSNSTTAGSGGTPFCPARDNPSFVRINAAKVMINNGTGSCLSRCDYTEMIAHETGHTLGAGHSDVPGALMAASLSSGNCGTLRSDDIDFAECAYPQITLGCHLAPSATWGGPPPMSVTFTTHITGGKPPYSYDYDFGDGTSDGSSSPLHFYMVPGTYPVSVRVTDRDGQECEDEAEITVQNCLPPLVSAVRAKFRNGIWKAVVLGSGFLSGATVEIDAGGGYLPAPVTKFKTGKKVVGKDVGAIWPAGIPVNVRVLSPLGCPSNPVQAIR